MNILLPPAGSMGPTVLGKLLKAYPVGHIGEREAA